MVFKGRRRAEHQDQELEGPFDGRVVPAEGHYHAAGPEELRQVQPEQLPPSQEQPESR